MNRKFLVIAGALSLAAACDLAVEDNIFSPAPPPYSHEGNANGGSGAGNAGGGGAGGSVIGMGDLPCDLAGVLAAHCDSCHAAAVAPLLRNRAEFMAPADSDPTKTMAEVSLERMQDAASPMPPAGLPPAADVTIFADWVAAGTPAGDCGGGTGGGSASPFDETHECNTSGTTWTNGDNGGDDMYPGRACNDCHQDERPEDIFTIAGTVYRTGHDPDDCLGVGNNEATIEVTDANDAVFTLSTTPTGNFSTKANYAFPITVKVIAGGSEIAMVTPVTAADGDCNTCHDENGNNMALGRIVVPF